MKPLLIITIAALVPTLIQAQVAPWYNRQNGVDPSVIARVSVDETTGDFRYEYIVRNGPAATQRLSSLRVEQVVSATAMAGPADWEFIKNASLGGLVGWYAGGEPVPGATVVSDLDVPSTVSEIPPDSALSGFVLVSPCAASGTVTYYARGYNHISIQPPDDTASYAHVPSWREDSVTKQVLGPGDCTTVHDWGNRRPGVDGFVGLVNDPGNRTGIGTNAPVTVQLRFARAGETVLPATLHVEINRIDVTARFVTNSLGDRIAVFEPGSAPLASGRNVLLVSVDGVVPGTNRTATDSDRFTFDLP